MLYFFVSENPFICVYSDFWEVCCFEREKEGKRKRKMDWEGDMNLDDLETDDEVRQVDDDGDSAIGDLGSLK